MSVELRVAGNAHRGGAGCLTRRIRLSVNTGTVAVLASHAAAETPWIAVDAAARTSVTAREVGAWTHPTRDDIPTHHDNPDHRAQTPALATAAPF